MEKKKILFVMNTMGQAGAETAVLALMKQFDAQKVDLSLYVLMGQGEMIKRLPPSVKLLNKRYCEVSVLAKEGRTAMMKKVLQSAAVRMTGVRLLPYILVNFVRQLQAGRLQVDKLLWRVLSDGAQHLEEEYDLAVAFLEGGSAYYVADHIKAKKKAAFVHIDYAMSGYTRKLDKDCYLKFDRVFTVSGEILESFLKVYPECRKKAGVFHNFLDIEEIRTKAESASGFTDDFAGVRLLTVGRLTYQKAYDIAIQALALLKQRGYPVRWYVLGDGPLRTELTQQIAQYGLEKDFILAGARDNPYPFFKTADIYVHATRFEGKSIAIQEAQILGCPIVASDCSGNREQIVNGVDGILCALTPKAIAEAIEQFINNPDFAGKCAVNAGKKQINHIEDMEKLYELLGETP